MKPNEIVVNDFCRLCKCSLVNRYGKYGSFLGVFKVSEKQDFKGFAIVSLYRAIGIPVDQFSNLLKRMCKPRERKVNMSELLQFVSAFNTPNHALLNRSEEQNENEPPDVSVKWLLPKTVF